MTRHDIAIIGAGCIFPGAKSPSQLWANILSGESYFSSMPDRLWPMKNFYSEDRSQSDKSYTTKGAFIEDFKFPFLKYRLPPNSLRGVDQAQLVSMEAAGQALADAGISPGDKVLNEAVTVIGTSGVDEFARSTVYFRRRRFFEQLRPKLQAGGVDDKTIDILFDEFTENLVDRGYCWNPTTIAVGAAPSSISNRVSQVFGLHGFNTTVDAACSSTMVALEIACHALMAKDAKIALAGGCDLGLNPAIYVGFSRVNGLSFSGSCNPFDRSADGLVMGEGAGLVVLKRLEDALEDGDKIKCVIRGIGSTSDGAGQAIYAPSVEGRAESFEKALQSARISPDLVQYIEAHATSTIVGDANEYDAISTVYGKRAESNPLYLGSIKYQIGHLKAAAGAAGIIKAILAMENETIPHMPNYEALTPGARLPNPALEIPTKTLAWKPNREGKRIGAVTTSGFGGTNYHCILERADEYEVAEERTTPSRKVAIVGVKARLAGADTVEEFWQNSTEKKDVFVPVDHTVLDWDEDMTKKDLNEQVPTQVIGMLKERPFDALRFKIFPNSISQISPTQFLALDLTDQLLSDFGLPRDERKKIGVSLGSMHDDYYPTSVSSILGDEYKDALSECPAAQGLPETMLRTCLREVVEEMKGSFPPVTEHTLPGWMTNITPGRLANKLNLAGANYTVDSACSSGLAAFQPAIYKLMFGDEEMMITGGVNRQTSDVFSAAVSQLGAVAKQVARPYDARGQGFLIGEGGVVFLIKLLEDAQRDGDEILGVIHSVAGSSEANSKSMVAPREVTIRRAIRQAVDKAGIPENEIMVVDTHGSANIVSDIAEANSIAAELRPEKTDEPVRILATKSHVGHLYGGSGASSVLSTLQSLRTGTVPGIRHLETVRPEIAPLAGRAEPQMNTEPLPKGASAGGVSSLGLGGATYFSVMSLPYPPAQKEKKDPKANATSPSPKVAHRKIIRPVSPELGSHMSSNRFELYLIENEPAVAAVLQEAKKRFAKFKAAKSNSDKE